MSDFSIFVTAKKATGFALAPLLRVATPVGLLENTRPRLEGPTLR